MWWLLACASGEESAPKVDSDDSGETGDTTDTGPHPSEVDVLVIGAGPAGLAAAWEASQAGASVRVLEREPSAGGAAMWASAQMLFSGTQLQADFGIEDSPELLLSEWAEITGGDPEDEWVQYFAHHNVDQVFDWLTGLGVVYYEPRAEASIGSVERSHEVIGGGPALIDVLLAHVPAELITYQAEAFDLALDSDRVVGVVWGDLAHGGEVTTYADTVVLATGGFMHDLERVRAERPDLDEIDLLLDSWTGDDGNGLALLEAYGAATENLGAIGLYAHGTPDPVDEAWALGMPFAGAAAWLNLESARFANEADFNGFHTGNTLAAQTEGRAWVIYDDALAVTSTYGNPDFGGAYDLRTMLEYDAVYVAEDLESLSGMVGLDAEAVADEVDAFNAYANGEAEDPFRPEGTTVVPIEVAPFYAVPILPSAAKGFGGIDTDLSGRVLAVDGGVLGGAYAAGELTGMAGGSLVGDAGFTGSLSAVVLSGRVAGAAAAQEALTR